MTTFVEHLINEGIPPEYHLKGTLDKKSLTKHLTRIAKDRPELYPDIVQNVKKVGDMMATFEGVSVGLDDITPDYAARDKLIGDAKRDIGKLTNDKAIIERLLKAQSEGLALGTRHKGSLQRQVESGSRGKPGQFLKTVFSPVVAKGPGDLPLPYLISKSYSEGLSPAEFWLTAGESRRELAQTQLATALPGDSSKVITNVLNNSIITKPDCGTTNGLDYRLDDSHIVDRYEAKTNKLITDDYIRSLQKAKHSSILVRSPMTCQDHPGVCQKCWGHNNEGQMHTIGVNVGMRSAQMLSEPLTQMVLSAKHGGQMARADEAKLVGTHGFRQLVGIPEIFKDQAVLAEHAGTVSSISKSPQGGATVMIGDTPHYVPPKREILVKKGERVVPGFALSDGIKNPRQVVELQGLGSGRDYMKNTIYQIYKESGVDIDKRHVELLVRNSLNHVKVTEGDEDGKFIKGDIVPYNSVREHLADGAKSHPLGASLIGKRLGDEYLHYAAGTPITPEIHDSLRQAGLKTVLITDKTATYDPIMKPLEQVPLLGQDWVSRMAHRRIKDTLIRGAAENWSSDIHGSSPYAAMIYGGQNFGSDIHKGHY
jgi:DNA-directed RNA polymerase subunit beta'